MLFADRHDAGRRLAAQLAPAAATDPVVVALPRGGVPVAHEIATALGAPLEILGVRKLGAPTQPEFAIGAVAEDGTGVIESDHARAVGVGARELEALVAREAAELPRRVLRYRGDRPPVSVAGRAVIVVDDGVATGLTDLAAVRALRAQGAAKIVLAVPVAAREALAMLAGNADDVVCLATPEPFGSVGRWYDDFSPVTDEEVVALLGGPGAPAADVGALSAGLTVPVDASGLVIFAHGSGSGRLSPRNLAVAGRLNARGLATLLFDLLTDDEARHRPNAFDIELLSERLLGATRWAEGQAALAGLPVGYFGASTGAAAALVAAAEMGGGIGAVVSRGGRVDLAAGLLRFVTAPTLLVVGGDDPEVLRLNREAMSSLRCTSQLAVVRGAGHLFEERGALEAVSDLAGQWFGDYLHAHDPTREIPLAGQA